LFYSFILGKKGFVTQKMKKISKNFLALQKVSAKRVKTIDMAQGQKVSRMVAWGWDGF